MSAGGCWSLKARPPIPRNRCVSPSLIRARLGKMQSARARECSGRDSKRLAAPDPGALQMTDARGLVPVICHGLLVSVETSLDFVAPGPGSLVLPARNKSLRPSVTRLFLLLHAHGSGRELPHLSPIPASDGSRSRETCP